MSSKITKVYRKSIVLTYMDKQEAPEYVYLNYLALCVPQNESVWYIVENVKKPNFVNNFKSVSTLLHRSI